MISKVDFLRELSLFSNLEEEELAALAAISDEFAFEEGAIIAYQRDPGNSLYMVRSGRLYAQRVDENGIVRDTRPYMPGQHFGQTWLFAPGTHPATVRASRDGRLLIIEGKRFLQFLEQFPGIIEAFEPVVDNTNTTVQGFGPEAWAEAQKYQRRADRRSAAVSLLPDELVEYQARRSLKYLLLTEAGLLLALIGLPTLAFMLLPSAEGFIWRALRLGIPSILALILGLIMAFRLLDWSNDYFVITNKHLTHREFDLRTFRINLHKIPIDQIQSVETVKPDLLSNLLDIGTARITTAAQDGILLFDRIDDPDIVRQTITRLNRRVKALDAGRAQATMRQTLEDYFHVEPEINKLEEAEEADAEAYEATPPSLWTQFWQRYRWRVEEKGVITYRKHFFALFREAAWPALIGIFLLVALFVVVRFFAFPLAQFWLIVAIIFFLDLLWLAWEIEDWRNETFQVTNRYIIDVDRKPFGFGQSRKQAPLANIQNVSADRPGLLPTIFNYGNVHVETAGAQADIIFESVPNPSKVQSDIFQRLDQVRRHQRLREGERQRQEYAVLLDVFKQATEQDRIPRRTPVEDDPDDDEVETKEEYS